MSGDDSTDDLVKGAGRERRDHLDDAVLPRRAREAQLTLGVSQLAKRRRGDVHGQARLLAEDLMRPVHGADVAQDPRAEPHALERRVVLADGDLVVRAAGVVRPRLVGEDALRDDLEVVQVEDLLEGRARVHERLAAPVCVGDGLDDLGEGLGVDGADVLVLWEVGGNGVGRVDGVVGICRVGTGVLQDDFASAGVLWFFKKN